MFPEKPLYFHQFIAEIGPTVFQIATFGWCLLDNEYEQAIYRAAIQVMQRIARGELDQRHTEFVYGGQLPVWFVNELDEIINTY